MEAEIETTNIRSTFFKNKMFVQQIEKIKKASDEAKKSVDYDSAHDDEILRAIDVIENFLRKKHRLCYGGQAVNAHLPTKYKFYDPEYSIPDYDFFTPNQVLDVNTIMKDLTKAGFTEIYRREGIHEGTIKIYVNFIPVADITDMDPKLYKLLSKREFKTDGISYLDANALRMLMYLELSRPRGDVSRWLKVFERLSLFNEFVSFKPCKISYDTIHGGLNPEQLHYTIDYIIKNKYIFAGADLLEFYKKSLYSKKLNNKWIFNTTKPILFFSSNIENDAKILSDEFNSLHKNSTPITIKSYSSNVIDMVPNIQVISQGKKNLVFIIEQSACHSYFNIPINKFTNVKIASMDTLITLYFSLGIIESKFFNIGSMECLANKLVEISSKSRTMKTPLPFISIKCIGYQPSFPSLIREKIKRTKQMKYIKNATVKRNVKAPMKAPMKATIKGLNGTINRKARKTVKNQR